MTYNQGNGQNWQSNRDRPNDSPPRAPELPEIPTLLVNDNLNPALFDEELLKKTAESLKRVSKTQMRKVFDEIKRFKFMLDANKKLGYCISSHFDAKTKISYLCKRKSDDSKNDASYYANLKKLIFRLIDMCNSKKSYEAYVTFIEALYGFYYEIAPVK